MLHAAAEPNALQRIQTLCEREVKALCQTQLSPAREAQVRQQFLGAMKISAESLFQQLIAQGKDLQDFQDLQPLTEALQKIEEVTAAEMLQVANEVFHPSLWHTVTYLPRNTDED
jgi:predicted Zn-dependent peptidase